MVEDVTLVTDLDQASVVVRAVRSGRLRILVAVDVEVAVTNDDTAVGKRSLGTVGGRVAKLMHNLGGVDKVILSVEFADGTCFEKCMVFKAGSLAVARARNDNSRLLHDCQHVRSENGQLGAVTALVSAAAEAGEEIGHVALRQHAGVELRLVALAVAESRSVLVVHVAVELIASSRCVAYRNGNDADLVINVVEIVTSVGAYREIRRVQAHVTVRIDRVGSLREDYALITPVAEVVNRRGPAHIVALAEYIAVEHVVGTVHIYAVAEYVRLTVRDVLPVRQVRIVRLLALRNRLVGDDTDHEIVERLVLKARHTALRKEVHAIVRTGSVRLPYRHVTTVGILAVRVAGLDEVRQVVAHLTRKVEMIALERSPAGCQGLKEEPQVNRMERARIVPARDVRIEIVVIRRCFVVGKCSLDRAL